MRVYLHRSHKSRFGIGSGHNPLKLPKNSSSLCPSVESTTTRLSFILGLGNALHHVQTDMRADSAYGGTGTVLITYRRVAIMPVLNRL